MIKKLIIILLIIGLFLTGLALAQEEEKLEAPEGLAELKELGKKFLEAFPEVFESAWKAVVDIWQKIWEWLKNLWDSYIFPWLEGIWQKIFSFSKKEFEKRKALLEIKEKPKEEPPEEEKPLEEEKIPEEKENLWKKLWERIKGLGK